MTRRNIAMLAGGLVVGGVCVFFARYEKSAKVAARHHAEHSAVTTVRPRPLPAAPRGPEQAGQPTANASAGTEPAHMIPTKDEWAEMAKTGSTRFCLPVAANWSLLDDIPSAAAHAAEIDAAYARSRQRLKEAFSPMCPDLADTGELKIVSPLMKCGVAVMRKSGPDGAKAARTEIDEFRGGLKPMPETPSQLKPESRVILTLTGEAAALVDDLSKTLGREDAEKLVFRPHGCAWQNGYEM